MSNNLDLPEMTENQAGKELTHNEALAALDAAITEVMDVDVSAGNVTLTAAEFREHMFFRVNNTTAARDLTVQAIKRAFVVSNESTSTFDVTVKLGATSKVLAPNTTILFYTDGTADGLRNLLTAAGTVTGFFLSDAGTKNVPGYAVGDADTGLFLQGAGRPALSANGVEIMRILDTMGVAISVGAEFDPTQLLHLRQVGGAGRLLVEAEGGSGIISSRYSSNNSPVSYVGRKYRGTIAAPLIVASGDRIFAIEGVAWSGSSLVSVATLEYVVAASVPSTTDLETRAVVNLTPAASVTPSEMLRLQYNNGLMMYGTNVVIDNNRLLVLRQYTIAGLPSAVTAGAGKMAYVTDMGGGNGLVISDGTVWRRCQESGSQVITTDANFTLTPLTSAPQIFHEGTLTAARTVTLSSTNVYDGAQFTIRRTGGGGFPLNVGYGAGGASTKTIHTGEWATFAYSASDGHWKRLSAGWLETPRPISFFFTTTPTTSEVLLLYTAVEYITIADNFAGSMGDVGTNPTASFVLDVQKNGVSVGSITISTGGAFTFNTTGTTVALAPGDQLKVVGPATPDATVANVSISFMGTLD